MLSWKAGFEIELLAPPGRSRADLAARAARRVGGRVRRFFHQQAEPSKAPGRAVFENLTLGFAVDDASGRRVAAFVDDLTLQADLNREARPRAGWYRIVADDARVLRLVARHCDAEAPLEDVLRPLAGLFGTEMEAHASGMRRVTDDRGVSVALAAPLPGERERPCEIVTAPIERDHDQALEALLEDARAEGFTLPREGAAHIHFDAGPLMSARTIARLVDVLSTHGQALKRLVGANPHCVRLGPWPAALMELTRSAAFQAMDWAAAAAALRGVGLSKYCDFNLLNLATGDPAKHTFEVRVPPSCLTAAPILEAAELFEALLRWRREGAEETPASLADIVEELPLAAAAKAVWRKKIAFDTAC